MEQLVEFIRESNRIEGIHRAPTTKEIDAHAKALARDLLTVSDLEEFVAAIQPGARLRREAGMNVRVGGYIAPLGGHKIEVELTLLLSAMAVATADPWRLHIEYERLHPFTDGNGRSGRMIWLRMMRQRGNRMWELNFLHAFYYQTLNAMQWKGLSG